MNSVEGHAEGDHAEDGCAEDDYAEDSEGDDYEEGAHYDEQMINHNDHTTNCGEHIFNHAEEVPLGGVITETPRTTF